MHRGTGGPSLKEQLGSIKDPKKRREFIKDWIDGLHARLEAVKKRSEYRRQQQQDEMHHLMQDMR
jgi:hypothetical protein